MESRSTKVAVITGIFVVAAAVIGIVPDLLDRTGEDAATAVQTGSTATVKGIQVTTTAARGTYVFKSPEDGAVVPWRGSTLTASVEGVPMGHSVWLVVSSDGLWPFHQWFAEPRDGTLTFEDLTLLSESESGVAAEILLVLADSSATESLREFVEVTAPTAGYEDALGSLPPGAAVVARLKVLRE